MKKSTFKTFCCVLIFILLPLILSAGGKYSSTPEIEDYDSVQMKASFIFRVAHLALWPENAMISDKQKPFIIGVTGDDELSDTLIKYIEKQKIMGKEVQVYSISEESLENLDKCNVLFIGEFSRRKFKHIIEAAEKYPILTIGDTKGYEKKGVMINLKDPFPSKISFAVNCVSAEKNGIRLTSKIVRYATTIIKK